MGSEAQWDYIIIGAGPAGLQAGQQLGTLGRKYLILEGADVPGASFETFPRHRKLISINKVYTGYDDAEINLRWDWNSLLSDGDDPLLFKQYSKSYFPAAGDLVSYLAGYAEKNQLNVRYRSRVTRVARNDGFEVHIATGEVFRAKVLIVATGVSQPWLPEIEGIEHVEPYSSVSLDPERFVNRRVLILGKGNSAFETADHLTETAAVIHLCSPTPLKMAWSTHFVGHLRAINNSFLDTYQLKSQNAIMDAQIVKIERVDGRLLVTFAYQHAEGEIEQIAYDDVIACTGFRFDNELFDEDCRPQLCSMKKLPVQMSNWESKNVPDLYFAGTVMQWRDYKKFMSGFIHGFRYNVRTLGHLLNQRYHGVPLPTGMLEPSVQALLDRIAMRINASSGLWQQPGFLGDLYNVSANFEVIEHREELPLDYIHEVWGSEGRNYLIATLEFGTRKFENPFNVSRIRRDNTQSAAHSNFLHPVIRVCRGGQVIAEHHVIEDLAAEWKEPEHLVPLEAFLCGIGFVPQAEVQAPREVKVRASNRVSDGDVRVH